MLEPSKYKLKKDMRIKQSDRCFWCGFKSNFFDLPFELHRIIPNRDGGKYERGNVFLFCKRCHIKAEGLSEEELLSYSPYGEFLIKKSNL